MMKQLSMNQMTRPSRYQIWGLGLLAIVAVGSIFACLFILNRLSASINTVKTPEKSQSIEEVLDEFLSAMASQDADRAATQWVKSRIIALPDDFTAYAGYSSVKIEDTTVDFGENGVSDDDQARVSGTVTYQDGTKGDFWAVLLRLNGTWRLDHFSLDVPPGKIAPTPTPEP
jgi:hypothetical protein